LGARARGCVLLMLLVPQLLSSSLCMIYKTNSWTTACAVKADYSYFGFPAYSNPEHTQAECLSWAVWAESLARMMSWQGAQKCICVRICVASREVTKKSLCTKNHALGRGVTRSCECEGHLR